MENSSSPTWLDESTRAIPLIGLTFILHKDKMQALSENAMYINAIGV
jgi:hypothetical protein